MAENEDVNQGTNEKVAPIDQARSIFSQDEIRTIVKEFVAAYVRGDVNIKFVTAEELMNLAKVNKERLDFDMAINQEISAKQPYLDLIAICAGSKKASPEELHKAVNSLFEQILALRSSRRLIGTFMTFDVDSRLSKLERDLNETNKLVAELLITVQGVLSSRGKS